MANFSGALPSKRARRRLTQNEKLVQRWIARNRGIIKAISEQVGLSAMSVHRIAYGHHHSREGKAETELAKRGWPGGSK